MRRPYAALRNHTSLRGGRHWYTMMRAAVRQLGVVYVATRFFAAPPYMLQYAAAVAYVANMHCVKVCFSAVCVAFS